jgi:hypothetical protein
VEVREARRLPGALDTLMHAWSCRVSAGAESHDTRTSASPVWHDEVFVFRGREAEGLRRHECFGVALLDHGRACGSLVVDLASLAHEMGFMDVEGAEVSRWFSLAGFGSEAAAGQLRLRVSLRPVAETRVQDVPRLQIVLGPAKGLGRLAEDPARLGEAFALVRCGARTLQTSLALCDVNGNCALHELFGVDEGWPEELAVSVWDAAGQELGGCVVRVEPGQDGLQDGVFELAPGEGLPPSPRPLSPTPETRGVLSRGGRLARAPSVTVQVGQRRPQLRVQVRRMMLEQDIRPVLGLVTLNPQSLNMFTHNFSHDVRLIVEVSGSGGVLTVGRTFARTVDVVFDEQRDGIRFAVVDVHQQVKFSVRWVTRSPAAAASARGCCAGGG